MTLHLYYRHNSRDRDKLITRLFIYRAFEKLSGFLTHLTMDSHHFSSSASRNNNAKAGFWRVLWIHSELHDTGMKANAVQKSGKRPPQLLKRCRT